ncbi:aldo-keto reductase AKR2E4-like [Danaus plexippus]|uniref:Seminal fluid protein CSSFP004 isoform 1 n=1 Tax=Danaus plexippus plexippus TaxID=278856 RepID=A0A212F244_DANPL|nr:aldo-keto reductase AKR2E4-like [Danaus plexippus]OWR47810.1 seminal fluid protein CSSFP004 isoform 1 [Danaus plexippus plexippus]
MSPKVMNARLNNGKEIPMVGLGTYTRQFDPELVKQAVEWGIDFGYRHIDTASFYKNEELLGEVIANKIKQGCVKREDLFVTTKLWSDSHSEEDVIPALKESLRKLKLGYIDLYLIHWPVSISENGEDVAIDYLNTWKSMEQAVNLGLAKSIGVSNFNEEQLERLYNHANIKPTVNQVEISPTLTQHKLVDFCKKLSVIPIAYTPLGLLSGARPEFIGKDVIKTDPKLEKIAEKYGKTKAQVVLRYLIQRGIPVIPKSFTKSRIEENLNIFDFELTNDEMSTIDGYNLDHRCVPSLRFKSCTYYPF